MRGRILAWTFLGALLVCAAGVEAQPRPESVSAAASAVAGGAQPSNAPRAGPSQQPAALAPRASTVGAQSVPGQPAEPARAAVARAPVARAPVARAPVARAPVAKAKADQTNQAPVATQPLQSGAPEPEASEPEALEPEALKAQQIRQLMDGTLDPAVDARVLFIVPLSELGSEAAVLTALSALPETRQASKSRKARKEQPDLTPVQQLALAQADFFRLSAEERTKLLGQHAERQRLARQAASAQQERRKSLEQTLSQIEHWRGLLDGTLDPKVDPTDLLSVSLLDSDELAIATERRQAFIEAQKRVAIASAVSATPAAPAAAVERPAPSDLVGVPIASATAPSSEQKPPAPALDSLSLEELQARLEAAFTELDGLRAAYLGLSPAARQALLDRHHERQRKAEEPAAIRQIAETLSQAEAAAQAASEEREQALAASRAARTEALRLLAEEKARLLGVKQAQALFSAELASRRQILETYREEALGWARRVRELAGRSLLDPTKETDADRMYDQLIQALGGKRDELREALREVSAGTESVPSPEGPALPESVDTHELDELRHELTRVHATQVSELEALVWDFAETVRGAVGTMNTARLDLLSYLTPSKHGALLGFGPAGVAQVRRELTQIGLEARFHWQAVPRHLTQIRSGSAGVSLFSLGLLLIKLLLLFVVFRWWRHRADDVLPELQKALSKALPNSSLSRASESLVWYVSRVRQPLEWLLLFVALIKLLEGFASIPEIEYLWIFVLWTTLGNAVVRFVDAIAARQTQSADDSAALRLRSLRLVGLSVVLLGLALSLTRVSVGRGAIYAWVITTCWWIALPIMLLLVHWWRPTVLARAQARRQPSPAIAWVARQSGGVWSYLGATLGGFYLLGEGLYRFALRHASHLAATQRLLAYLFRREVEKQAERRGDATYEPLDEAKRQALSIDADHAGWIDSVAQEQLEIVDRLAARIEGAVIAVNGERGRGKSSFISRVIERHAATNATNSTGATNQTSAKQVPDFLRINCQPGGFRRFVEDVGTALGLGTRAKESSVRAALESRRPALICVDDAQRLIRPLIGGLDDIDHLIGFARAIGGPTVWVVALGAPAWQYLLRARGERALFDEIIELGPWPEPVLTELLQQRSAFAGFDAHFDDLVVPRQMDGSNLEDERDSTERDYARILWDYSKGNPGVALHFWRESLHMKNGEVYVRLFSTPPTAELENLPSTLYFVLRAILQLELALEGDIVLCTDLAPAEVADAVRFALSRRYVERVDDRLRLTWEWYRAVTQVLQRQHLVLL